MVARTVRLAFLNGGHNTGAFFEKHGGRRDWFQRLFEKAAATYYSHLNLEIDVVEYNPLNHEWPNLDFAESTTERAKAKEGGALSPLSKEAKWDAIVIPGNRHGVYEAESQPWIANLLSFMKMAWEATELPIVGVCFGHQIMAKALGGEVTLNPQGLEDGITAIRLTDEGRRMLGTSKSSFAINAAHQDAVITMPVTPGIVNMGTTSLCAFQGMHLPGRLLTVQNHPELTVPATIDVVSTHGMDQAAFEAWRERQVELEQKGLDDVWVGGKLLGFILRGGKSIPSDVELETGKV